MNDTNGSIQTQIDTSYEGHIDWVNAIVLLNRHTLASCSSDKTIRIWGASETGGGGGAPCACLHGAHTEYVTSLVASTVRPILASAGLKGELFLWDVNRASSSGGGGGTSSTTAMQRVEGLQGSSIYSLAGDHAATVLAAGTSDGCIWLIDTRTARAEAVLRGHSANVKSLTMRQSDGSCVVSGAADHTVRAWDVRQRRSYATLAVHTDSVWTVIPAPAADSSGSGDALTSVYSGGRDGSVYKTNIALKTSELVGSMESNKPVTALLFQPSSSGSSYGRLWVATTSSTLTCWNVPSDRKSPYAFAAGSLPAVRGRTVFATASGNGGTNPDPHQPTPSPYTSLCTTIPGLPPIRQVAVLTNRRHVLTQDDENNVLLWDLSQGAPIESLGKATSLAEAERARFDPAHNVWPWFQPDTRLGCLAGVMEAPGCFLAEAYRRDLGDLSAPADAKVNMAEYMLGALFDTWAERRWLRGGSGGDGSGDVAMTPDDNDNNAEQKQKHHQEQQQHSPDKTNTTAASSPSLHRQKNAFQLQRHHASPVVMISGTGGHPPLRKAVDDFDGTEVEGEDIPQWVADCVLRHKVPIGKDLKMAFILVPAPRSGLPSLLQSKLNAPRVLSIDKVADYVMRKMAEQGIVLAEEPLFWSPQKQALWEQEQQQQQQQQRNSSLDDGASPTNSSFVASEASGGAAAAGGEGGALALMGIRQLRPMLTSSSSSPAPPSSHQQQQQHHQQPLLITCGGAAVPWDFTLAAVKQWMWKRPEELRLEYGIRDKSTVLTVPTIRPPQN